MSDLFGGQAQGYPDKPGVKERDGATSQEAADAVAERATYLRGEVYRILRQSPEPMTADQVASVMGESILSIRPRMSELKKVGRVAKTAQRGQNASGRSAVKWKAA